MILPQTYYATLGLLILSMLCWGSWANTLKLTGKWRFELYYFDYAFGTLLAAAVAAFTFGSLGFDGFSFLDDLLLTGKRNLALGAAAGAVFNLANMLLVAAITVAGMAVAFPMGIGLALVIGVVWSYLLNPVGSPVLLFGGAALVLGAVIINSVAYRLRERARQLERAKQGLLKTSMPRVSPKGIILSLACGLLMGSFFPLVEMAKHSGIGAGPYTIGFMFAAGIFASTFVFNLFFMNLPVEGRPVEIRDYFLTGSLWQHALGVLGGVIWFTGAIANFVAASAEGDAQAGPAVSYGLGQGATMISALWGIFLWKEFSGADLRVRLLLAIMFVLFLTGLGLVSVAPLYSAS
jgi:glucose uptake protein